MGGCLSNPQRPQGRRSSSRTSSFCCAGVPEASLSNAPNGVDFEESIMWITPPPIAIGPEGLQGGEAKCRQLSPPARAILVDSFQWATVPTPLVSSQLHQEAIRITTSSVVSEAMTRAVTNSDKSISSFGMAVDTTGGRFAAQGQALLSHPDYKGIGKRQPSLASIRAGVKRRGVVDLSVEQCNTPTICPTEGSPNTSPKSSLRRPRTSSPATLEIPNSPDDMEFITNALNHPSHLVQVKGPRSEYQFSRSRGWNKITVQENSGKDGECSGQMWWKKDGEPISM